MDLKTKVPQEKMVAWRRHLHRHPELSFHEYETVKYIENILRTYPELEIEKLTKTSVIARLKGLKPGKTIALRADIDALPITEEADVEFPSKNHGVMHACGHDTHTAMLLGAVDTLVKMREELSGTVKFIFQHAEELPPGGAVELVQAGVMDDVDMVFGLHIFPMIPAGMIGISPGAFSSASDVASLTIKGRGAHGSMPDLSVDPILIGSEIVTNLNHIISRNVSPLANSVISVGAFHSGSVANIIPDTAQLELTIRNNDPEVREFVKKRMEAIIDGVCSMYGAEYDFEYTYGYDAVINDEKAVELVKAAAVKTVGEENLFLMSPMMGGEDFSAYTQVRPGAFFVLGGGTAEEGCAYINHHPKFKINEACFPVGAAMHVQLILDLLAEGQ